MGNPNRSLEGDIGAVPSCAACSSELVVKDAWATWNPDYGLWEIETVFDAARCHACEATTTLAWARQEIPPNQKVRELNDRFRREGHGRGSMFVTQGLQGLGGEFVVNAIRAVRDFDAFTDENDPWGEHDFGAIDLADQKVFWKIDAYNRDLTAGSENPGNEGETHRVLTIMLASEY